MSKNKSLFEELKSRNVFRAAVSYTIVCWLLLQVADVVAPYLGIKDIWIRWMILAAIAGFPIVIWISWIYEHPWKGGGKRGLVSDLTLLMAIVVATGLLVVQLAPRSNEPVTSIALVPFETISSDQSQTNSAEVFSFELNSLLGSTPTVLVKDWKSTNHKEIRNLNTDQLAYKLDAKHVLRGSFRVVNNKMKVSVQLTDNLGNTIWQSLYDKHPNEIDSVQEDIVTNILREIDPQSLKNYDAGRVAKPCHRPRDWTLIEMYYQARFKFQQRGIDRLKESLNLITYVVEKDPEFAEAWEAMASIYAVLMGWDRENYPPAKYNRLKLDAARTALSLCESLGEAYLHANIDDDKERSGNGMIDWERTLLKAIDHQPNNVTLRQWLVRHMRSTGRIKDSIEHSLRSQEIDPMDIRVLKQLVAIYRYIGDDLNQLKYMNKARDLGVNEDWADPEKLSEEMDPNNYKPYEWLAGFGVVDYQDKIARYNNPDTKEEARTELYLLVHKTMAAENATFWTSVELGEIDFAIDMLRNRTDNFYFPNIWAEYFDKLRSHPDFASAIEETTGLIDYWNEFGWPDMCRPEKDRFVCSG